MRSDVRVPVQVVPQAGVLIGHDYYCKTPEGLRTVLTGLRVSGYVVKGLRFGPNVGSVAEFERRCTPMWSATLPGSEMAQCLGCEGIIDPTHTAGDGRPCEFCGVQTMQVSTDSQKVPNTRQIIFWRGKVYPSAPGVPGAFPYPTHIQVYEARYWANRLVGSDLAYHLLATVGGIKLDAQWYEPEDRLADMRERLTRMNRFVLNFTRLDPKLWGVVMEELKGEKLAVTVRARILRFLGS